MSSSLRPLPHSATQGRARSYRTLGADRQSTQSGVPPRARFRPLHRTARNFDLEDASGNFVEPPRPGARGGGAAALRIALVSHSDSPWAPYYTRYLSARGHEVHLLSFSPKRIEGAVFHYVGAEPPDGRLPKWIYLWRVPKVARLLRRIDPDVVLATYYRSNGLVAALAGASPLIVSTRGIDAEFSLPLGLGPVVSRWVASRAAALHASSPELVEILAALGVPAERFEVFPLGTDPQIFTPREGPRLPGPPRIICTRKHETVYDNPTVVRALALLCGRGIPFEARFLAGGSELPATRRLSADLGLDAHVTFLGDLDHHAVPAHLRWADIYVSAATADGAPSSLFEAMSCRLYPVVTDVRANRDWIVQRKNGDLFAPGNPSACAHGLEFAATNLSELEAVTGQNRTLVSERLDRETNLARLESMLARVGRRRLPQGS